MTPDATRPEVEAVTLRACPPGLFLFRGTLSFKSEYKTESKSHPGFWQSDAYVVESGEYFWGASSDPTVREQLRVTPVDLATYGAQQHAAGMEDAAKMVDDCLAGTKRLYDEAREKMSPRETLRSISDEMVTLSDLAHRIRRALSDRTAQGGAND